MGPVNVFEESREIRRPRPPVEGWAGFFWRSGDDGRLRIQRCEDCDHFIHPPMPVCPQCASLSVSPSVVSGKGTIRCFTVNEHSWYPGMAPPYVVAEVELDEQDDLLLMTSIVDCPVEKVRNTMRVEVRFVRTGNAFVPVFRPSETSDE